MEIQHSKHTAATSVYKVTRSSCRHVLKSFADTIGEWMEDLRKGRADVLESGHSLILGWSDKVLPIVDQLCNANASEDGRPIVIMAEMEKQAMEECLAKHAPNLRGSTVVCR